MGYSPQVHERVKNKFDTMQLIARENAKERRKYFFKIYPRAQEIHKELSLTAVKIAKMILEKRIDTATAIKNLQEHNERLTCELDEILTNAGVNKNYLDVIYKCEKCQDTGYIDGKLCSCAIELLKREAYGYINLKSGLKLHTFDEFSLSYYSDQPISDNQVPPKKRMQDIFTYCQTYAENFDLQNKSILMKGGTGLGKTHLSLSIAKKVIDKGYGVVYVSVPYMLSQIEEEHFSLNESSNEIFSHLTQCDLLILDDLGTEFSTKFTVATIYNIINTRILFSLPTIINTNMTLKEIETAYSQRLISRIIENYVKLDFLGNDIRQIKNGGMLK